MIFKRIFVIFLYIFGAGNEIKVLGISARRERIVGGSNTLIRDFPHLASFRIELNEHFCAGSIIAPLYILSAGHCFIDHIHDFDKIRVYTGTNSALGTSGDVHEIDTVIFHPRFSWNFHKIGSPRDICIVKLKREIQFNGLQNKIKLPSRDIFDDNLALLAGWGLSYENSSIVSNNLLRAPVTLYDFVSCTKNLGFLVYEDQCCSCNPRGVEICPTDTGGSVTSNGELYGVIIINNKNPTRLFGIHTKVYPHLEFIRGVLGPALEE